MIQIYKPTNDNFKMNGDACLHPLSCYAEMNLNGAWTLTLENNLDDNIDLFVKNAVISAPTPYGDNQLFRIYNVEKSIVSVKCIAYPIFLDARYDCFLHDVRPTNKNGQDALQIMVASNPKYSASSNITKANTSYYLLKNLMEAINGDDENSFINRWGGEIIYKNFEIIINERIGSSEKNLICKRGLNQLGIVETVDTKNLVTRIIPKGFNGRLLPNNESVDSDRINAYPIPYIKVIEYSDIKLSTDEHISESDTVYDTLDELYQGLRERAKKEFTDYQIDIPDISYDVEMIDQYELDEYKMFKEIMKCNLGDDLICHDEVLNIHNIKARIIQIVYDCINKRNISLKIGKYTNNFFDELSRFNHSAQKVIDTKDSTLVGERLKGILNLLNLSLKAQKDVAQKQDVRAIQFEDSDPDSPTFGAMCIGTQGIQIAKKRNETNTDWAWGTAIDFQAIYAQYIIAGTLSDKLGLNYWNLDTGEFRLSANTKVGNTTLDDYIKNKIPDTDDLSQEEVFNALTNNGSIKGIYMYNGQLYVNGGYINADTLSAISANLGNITAGSININGKFIVTSDGKVTATDGTFTGTVNAKSGSIAGFTFDENVMTASITKTFNYTESDCIRIRNIILGTTTATSADYERLDINGDGRISSQDYVMIKNLISYGNKITTTFKLDPRLNDGNIKEAMLEISVPNYNTTRISKLGALYSSYASFDYISLEGNDIKDIFSPVGAKTDNGSLVKLWEGSSRVTDEFTVSDDYKFFLVRPGTASGYYNTWIIVPYLTESNSGVFRGIGGFEDSAGGEIYFLRGSVTNGNAKIETCWYRTTANMTNNNSSVQCYIKEVWGVK